MTVHPYTYKANDANFALAAGRVIIFDGSYPF